MPTASSITIRQDQMLIALGRLGATVSDVPDMLRVIGAYMLGSIAKTFRDQGSPAGSWPELAASTRKKKGYTAGHKLLILSGRLFGSITAVPEGNTLHIGTGLVYGPVHQFGSADRRGGSIGAQAKIPGRESKVSAYDYLRMKPFKRFGTAEVINEFGEIEKVRTRHRGPANARKVSVGAHDRHQNIPARPYLVFRPEDPGNMESALAGWMKTKSAGVIQ